MSSSHAPSSFPASYFKSPCLPLIDLLPFFPMFLFLICILFICQPYILNCLRFLINQVTFVVTHFNDPRISSADLKDLLLHSISVLVQYKEYLVSFESNEAATQNLPKSLLLAFDNRSWIPVTNILLRLCKCSGFDSSKYGESSSSSIIFQVKYFPLFESYF